jgi:GTP-binding protein
LHIIDGTSESPADDMMRVNEELALFDNLLAQKPQLIALNKIDLPDVQERLAGIKKELHGAGIKAHYISAATGQGVSELMAETLGILKTQTTGGEVEEKPVKVFRPQPKQSAFSVGKVGDEYVISAPELERIFAGVGATPADLRWQLNHQIKRLGVSKALEKAGVKAGDKIRCGELTWEW